MYSRDTCTIRAQNSCMDSFTANLTDQMSKLIRVFVWCTCYLVAFVMMHFFFCLKRLLNNTYLLLASQIIRNDDVLTNTEWLGHLCVQYLILNVEVYLLNMGERKYLF